MYKSVAIILLIILDCSFIYCQNLDSLVQNVINQINLDSLSSYVEILSGKKEWELNETSYTIVSRHAEHEDNNVAADYLKLKLQSWGLDTYDQQYSATGRNIYALQPGNIYPDQYYILCAHYDSMPPGPLAPGADDNASGVANVLEAARILKNYNPAYSIIYAFWDEEEIAHNGSLYFAEQASEDNMDILGVINVDMIGFDHN
ncbi:MAG: M20/M25/M40 family metallo-hydrolase, partial [Ignavibacteria bacterium]